MYRKSWVERHMLLTALAVMFAFSVVVSLWYVLLPLAVLAGGLWFGTIRYDRAVHARRIRRAQLAAHADYEHHLWTHGHPQGLYGMFPPYM